MAQKNQICPKKEINPYPGHFEYHGLFLELDRYYKAAIPNP
ncbi:Hypothetical protein I595_2436 [Croceitalea dokdonensis DOKDO 023]|uniref:Uncharacterized protein n=1 Tax=Croceitalea dokdonensis DOKDO 023 TaxID=1300341 RepID=A0A0N8H3P8_9FLAO|nr:Hypothetical protein I595_2436 [Croceitalea dokdonensis DOKDO 023]